MRDFIKTTVFGGIVFLLPLVVVGAAFGKVLSTIHAFVTPALDNFGVQNVLGAALFHMLPFIVLIMLCFLAGLLAKTPVVGGLVTSFDQVLREKIPSYGLIRDKVGSALSPGEVQNLTPVLVRFDDAWQVAFKMDELSDGRLAVFLPGSPDPWSGSVSIVDADRVSDLDVSVKAIHHSMKRLGKGAAKILDQD